MNYQTISEIYEGNDKIREKLKAVVSNLTENQANTLPEGEKWTAAQFVEHIAIVEEGITTISAKLLSKAQAVGAAAADGTAKFSEEFMQKIAGAREAKFEAPERVHPTGTKTIGESLARMDENRRKLNELRPLFESVDASDFRFPHPAFGELSAHEWLAVLGGHEARHLRQIEKLLGKIQ